MRAIICGAGIAGLSLARLLDSAGWEVLLVERSRELRDEGYMIDFFGPGLDAAQTIGVLPRLRELAYPVEEITYVNRQGRRVAGLDYRRFGNAVGSRPLTLLRGDLEHALYEGLGDRVELRFGCTIDAVEQSPDEVVATLSDGSRCRADLLVGADGIHSRVRELVFGPERAHLRCLGFHTAAYTFPHRELHARLGGRFAMTDSVDRLMGLYGARGGQVAVFAVHRVDGPAMPADPKATLRRVYADLGWVVPEALDHCPGPPALYYDQVAQIEMSSWSRGRVTLVGDACQAVSLLAGQGASLAMAGAHLLAGELAQGGKAPDALARYQARLLPVVREKQLAGRRGAEWFLPPSRPRLFLRHLALRLMHVPGLDRMFGKALVGATS